MRNGDNMALCLFGDTYTEATVLSSTEIACDSPPVSSPIQNVPVGISLTGEGGVSDQPLRFSYYKWHTISGIEPKTGTSSGGTPITIQGSGFDQPGVCEVVCRFGTVEVPAKSYNETDVQCGSPDTAVAGDTSIALALNGQ